MTKSVLKPFSVFKSLIHVLLLVLAGLLIGCAAVATPEPDMAQTIPNNIKTENVKLGLPIPPPGPFVEPVFRPHQYLPRSSTFIHRWKQYRSTSGITYYTSETTRKRSTMLIYNERANQKTTKLPFDIVKHPESGILEIRGVKELVEETGQLGNPYRRQKPITLPQSTNKPGNENPEQNESVKSGILHLQSLYYMPTSQFENADEFVLKLHAIGRAKSQLIKYIVTH